MDDDTRWLGGGEADAWLGLVAVMELLPVALDSQLTRDARLTFFEFLTLAQLAEVPEREMRLTDLAAGTNASLPRISRVVARLERDGLIERRHNESDARARNVRLTEMGRDKLAEASPRHIGLVNQHFTDVLSREQITQLTAICDRIIGSLDPERRVFAETFRGRSGRPGLSRPVATREND
ncbi:MarR family transcriptional regulator [Aeromicrobium camelliae]|uniref:MarR family transcriptional regulator n=1 Tax=Aeromicrobium camelliae TaxID=1538144 RepID=A0A3N6W4D4_9ACTN|nr:MarR family winged helix-turn-helix transcriptional regulator [Aeromicrobium camelliae]RQN02330.1 MarR family transcriptional regulator [Aeromicrobium camelliae]